jgi:hypothetical protein
MPKFKVGDRVERIGILIPIYMGGGIVTAVIPRDDLPAHFTEYDVDFKFVVARFYESQLRLAAGDDR